MQRQSAGGRTRAGIFLVGSILLALLASFIVLNMIRKAKQAAEKEAQTENITSVVIAAHDLYMGLPLTEEDVVLVQLPANSVPEGYVFHSVEEVVNRTPRERILGNELIRIERLADQRAGIGLNAVIATGKRAMTVVTNTEQAVAGLLQAGNYVDIIVAIKPEDPTAFNAKYVSQTILQGIKVLAVGGQMNSSPRPKTEAELKEKDKDKKNKPAVSEAQDPKMAAKLKPSITLEVGPDEAEKLALAQTQGDIYVTLRSDTDIIEVPEDALVTVATLIGVGAPAPVAAPPPKPDRPVAPKAPPPEAPAPDRATVVSGSNTTEYVIGEGGAEAQNNKKGRKPNK